jgi:Tol biopolymer transport system component
MAADGSNQRPLTPAGIEAYQPAWSPDGTEVVYVTGEAGDTRLRVIGIDGAGDRPLTPEGAPRRYEGWPSWAP